MKELLDKRILLLDLMESEAFEDGWEKVTNFNDGQSINVSVHWQDGTSSHGTSFYLPTMCPDEGDIFIHFRESENDYETWAHLVELVMNQEVIEINFDESEL